MKITKSHVLSIIICLMVVSQGCSDKNSSHLSDGEGANIPLAEQLNNERAHNEALKDKLVALQKENKKYSQKLRYLEWKSKGQDYIIHQVIKFALNKIEFQKQLLNYFGFNHNSAGRNPYLDLCNLELWHINDSSWNIFDYYFTRMDRNKEKIEMLFQRYKDDLFSAMDDSAYANSYAEAYVEILLHSYENIMNNDSRNNFFEKISNDENLMDSQADHRKELVNAYELQFGCLSDDLKIFNHLAPGYKLKTKYWAYSFWLRRHNEGNSEIVAKILNEIQSHYVFRINTAHCFDGA